MDLSLLLLNVIKGSQGPYDPTSVSYSVDDVNFKPSLSLCSTYLVISRNTISRNHNLSFDPGLPFKKLLSFSGPLMQRTDL